MPFVKRDLVVEAPPLAPKSAQWEVRQELTWEGVALPLRESPGDPYPTERRRLIYSVAPGSTTDFASIPRIFWWILAPWKRIYVRPAVLHDRLSRPKEAPPVPQYEADRVFRIAMREEQTPFALRWIMWALVRWRRFDLFRSVRTAGPWQMLGALALSVLASAVAGPIGLLILGFWLVLNVAGWLLDRVTYPLMKAKYEWPRWLAVVAGLLMVGAAAGLLVVGLANEWASWSGWYPYVCAVLIAVGITFTGPSPEEPEVVEFTVATW
ncbi:MAG: DUF1353 domain-containing protein [Actinobacteria bacterium]|nr:DUF1353 domain-containing protein [Actinomycetota bacterium]